MLLVKQPTVFAIRQFQSLIDDGMGKGFAKLSCCFGIKSTCKVFAAINSKKELLRHKKGACGIEPPTTPLGFNELQIAGVLCRKPVELVKCISPSSTAPFPTA